MSTKKSRKKLKNKSKRMNKPSHREKKRRLRQAAAAAAAAAAVANDDFDVTNGMANVAKMPIVNSSVDVNAASDSDDGLDASHEIISEWVDENLDQANAEEDNPENIQGSTFWPAELSISHGAKVEHVILDEHVPGPTLLSPATISQDSDHRALETAWIRVIRPNPAMIVPKEMRLSAMLLTELS